MRLVVHGLVEVPDKVGRKLLREVAKVEEELGSYSMTDRIHLDDGWAFDLMVPLKWEVVDGGDAEDVQDPLRGS
jgi:hypothetical protein